MKLGPYDLDTIYTGDARLLAPPIPNESIDLILTDPPFGIGYDYGNSYKDDPKAYPDLVRWIVGECNRLIKPGGLCFVYVAQLRLRHVWPLFPDDSRIFAACKGWVQMRPTAVQYAYDPVIFWQKGRRVWSGRDWHVAAPAHIDPTKANFVADFPCPRPLDTISYIVQNWSESGNIVLDWFMGSGTTAVAAKMLSRHWLGFEIDPQVAERARLRVLETQPPLFIPEPEQLTLERIGNETMSDMHTGV